jgi:hypothetical protein
MFSEELDFFIAHQDELVKKHRGKFLALKGKEILGVFSTAMEAYIATQTTHKLGSFMIQPCEVGVDAYTVTIASAVFVDG